MPKPKNNSEDLFFTTFTLSPSLLPVRQIFKYIHWSFAFLFISYFAFLFYLIFCFVSNMLPRDFRLLPLFVHCFALKIFFTATGLGTVNFRMTVTKSMRKGVERSDHSPIWTNVVPFYWTYEKQPAKNLDIM